VALTWKGRWLLALAAAACGGWAHAQQAPSAGAPAAQAVLDRVNHYRGLAGVPRLAADPALHAAAQAHTQYMAELGQLSHAQSERTSPHYTGATLEERLRQAGATFSRTGEAVGLANRDDPIAVVDDLMSTIYHRLLLLAPDFGSGGAGVARGEMDGMEVVFVAIDLTGPSGTGTPSPMVTTYPANRQDGVPADFDPATETPNPMPELQLVGQPVTVQAAQDAPLVVDRFRLVMAGSSEPVDAKLLTRSNDMQMPEWAAALIPLQPLQPGTGYQASFSGSIAGAAVHRTWRFRTAATR
jgi:uncharacterized protein YkwD